MKKWLYLPFLLLYFLLLPGCGGDNSPDIEAQFAKELPQDWQLDSFDIQVKEEVGTKVDPQVHFRFVAEISPKQDLHQKVGTLMGTDILKLTQEKGKEAEIHGTARSLFNAGEWKTFFDIENVPFSNPGLPATSFAAKQVVQGSGDYKKLLKTAKDELTRLEQQVQSDERLLAQGMADYGQLNQQLQEKARISSEQFSSLQQQLQQQRYQIQQQGYNQNRDLNTQQQAERQKQLTVYKQQLDAKVAEVEKQHRLKTAEFNAERTKAQQSRTQQLAQLKGAYNTDFANARKTMDRAALITYKAQADEKLRTDVQAVDQQYSNQLARIKTQETEQANARRTLLDQYNAEYRQHAELINQQMAAQMNTSQAEMNQQQQADIAKLDAELTAARNSYQEQINNNHQQLNQKRNELDQLQRKLYDNKSQLMNSTQLLAALERETY